MTYNYKLYNVSLSSITSESLSILIIIASLVNILIKTKIFYFKRIYSYKSINKREYLR